MVAVVALAGETRRLLGDASIEHLVESFKIVALNEGEHLGVVDGACNCALRTRFVNIES